MLQMTNFKILILDVGIFRVVQSEYVFHTGGKNNRGCRNAFRQPCGYKTNY